MDQVKFTQMKDGDAEDYAFLTEHEVEYTKGTADRLLTALVSLDESLSGYQITRLGHSLQSASRAERDGADIDWIVAALLHDIGDIFAPYNQGHPYFDDCAAFCERWDQSSFDPAYDHFPLEHFTDRVREVFARAPYDPAVIRAGEREPLHTA